MPKDLFRPRQLSCGVRLLLPVSWGRAGVALRGVGQGGRAEGEKEGGREEEDGVLRVLAEEGAGGGMRSSGPTVL